MDMRLKVKIYLENENDKFMGIGVLWLLQAIEQNSSLRAAAMSLDMSYSKAYAMITNLEKALGEQVVVRRKGGSQRGGVVLSDFGKDFVRLYDDFQRDCKKLLEKPFSEFEKKLGDLRKGENHV